MNPLFELPLVGPISINGLHESKKQPPVNLEKVNVDKHTAAKIADAYDAMLHDPNSPAVRHAYDALIGDTKEQWTYAQRELGMRMTILDEQPYSSAEEMFRDVTTNPHIGIWSGEGEMPADHPLHEVDPETGLTFNTLFRAIHDTFGHTAGHNYFTEEGEENAYHLHKQSFSIEAIPALATETRGQACWIFNNRDIREWRMGPTRFPPQKAGILPEEFYELAEQVGSCRLQIPLQQCRRKNRRHG